jgi:hypothetical protein
MRCVLLVAVTLALAPAVGLARTVEPGSIWATGAIGPGFRAGSRLGGSGTYLMLNAQGEYALSSELGLNGELSFGLAGSQPLKLRLGGRYRLNGLVGDMPISPYVLGQLSVGKLYDVLGANLTTIGLRAGGGADYFLTADLSVGAMLGWELARTTGERGTTYSQVELLVTASMLF